MAFEYTVSMVTVGRLRKKHEDSVEDMYAEVDDSEREEEGM